MLLLEKRRQPTVRPGVFEIDKQHPWADGMFFGGFAKHRGGSLYCNSGYGGDATTQNITDFGTAWIYDGDLRRSVLKVVRASSQCALGPTYTGTPSKFTMSVWVNAASATGSYPTPFSNFDGANDRNGIGLYFYNAEPICETCQAGGFTYYRTSSGILVANVWQHYAITYNAGYLYFYLNGNVLTKSSGAAQGSFGDPVCGAHPVVVGSDGPRAAALYFDGMIGDPILWIGRTLSDGDIRKLADRTDVMLNRLLKAA